MTTVVRFRLYVAGDAPHSRRAEINLRAFCRTELGGCGEIEIVDLLTDPVRALTDKVLLTPTLAVLEGGTVRRIVGDLSDTSVLADLLASGGACQWRS